MVVVVVVVVVISDVFEFIPSFMLSSFCNFDLSFWFLISDSTVYKLLSISPS